VIGRLVEQQDVWVGEQRPGQQRAAFIAAGEGGKVLIAVEFDAVQNVLHFMLQCPAVGLVELVLQVVEFLRDRFVFGMLADFVQQVVVFRNGAGGLAEPLRHDFKDRAVEGGRHLLVEFTDAQIGDGLDLALIEVDLRVEDAEQGGFALAVASEQADALALGDSEPGIVEEFWSAERDGKIAVAE